MSLPIRLALAVSFALLAGAARAAEVPAPSLAAAPASLTGEILARFMLAEIAARRGQAPLSAQLYVDLARRTRDARIARRATEMAFATQQYEAAAEGARIWAAAEPASSEALQYVAVIAAEGYGTTEGLEPALRHLLSNATLSPASFLMQLPRFYARTDDPQAAAAAIERLTEPYLAMPEAYMARAAAYDAVQDKTRALAAVERALGLRPEWEAAAVYRLQITPVAEKAAAVAQMQRFVERNPQAREARIAHVQALIDLGREREARVALSKLVDEGVGDDPFAYRLAGVAIRGKFWDIAERQLQALIVRQPKDAPLLRLQLGEVQESAGRLEEALATYRSVPAGAQFVAAQASIAALMARRGQLGQGRALLRKAALEHPGHRAALLLAEAQLLEKQKDLPGAQRVLEEVLATDGENADALYQLAMLREKRGQYEAMERDLRRLIALKPDSAHAYNALGYSFADRNVQLDEADRLLSRALELMPNDAAILDSVGWLRYRQGKLPEALRYLRRAFSLMPDAEIAAHLGEVLWKSGRVEEARRVWAQGQQQAADNKVLTETIRRLAGSGS